MPWNARAYGFSTPESRKRTGLSLAIFARIHKPIILFLPKLLDMRPALLVYVHSVTGEERYLEQASVPRGFSWGKLNAMSSLSSATHGWHTSSIPGLSFADCYPRGVPPEIAIFLNVASCCGRAMANDYAGENAEFHPVLVLPEKKPAPPPLPGRGCRDVIS